MRCAADDAAALPVSGRSGGIGRGVARTSAAMTDALSALHRNNRGSSYTATAADERRAAAR